MPGGSASLASGLADAVRTGRLTFPAGRTGHSECRYMVTSCRTRAFGAFFPGHGVPASLWLYTHHVGVWALRGQRRLCRSPQAQRATA